MSKMKQSTLLSLKGVVVVEDFHRQKNILDNKNIADETILETLNYLEKKKPCKEVIANVGIDLTLQGLINHKNEIISKKAEELLKFWNSNISLKCQPTVEVRYDNLTKHIRRRAVQFFTEALGGQETDEKIADTVEKEIFHKCHRLISKNYRRVVRKVTFILRHHEKERNDLRNGLVTHVQFVVAYINDQK